MVNARAPIFVDLHFELTLVRGPATRGLGSLMGKSAGVTLSLSERVLLLPSVDLLLPVAFDIHRTLGADIGRRARRYMRPLISPPSSSIGCGLASMALDLGLKSSSLLLVAPCFLSPTTPRRRREITWLSVRPENPVAKSPLHFRTGHRHRRPRSASSPRPAWSTVSSEGISLVLTIAHVTTDGTPRRPDD